MLWRYFDVQIAVNSYLHKGKTISHPIKARFKQNRLTRRVYVFQANCAPDGFNTWNEPGYGYGAWKRVS